jgi:hypothetical protein
LFSGHERNSVGLASVGVRVGVACQNVGVSKEECECVEVASRVTRNFWAIVHFIFFSPA